MSIKFGSLLLLVSLSFVGVGVAQTPIVSPNTRFTVIRDRCAAPGTVRASILFDTTVYDDKGNDVGHVKDIALDVSQDRVSYVALSHAVGAFDRKTLAVPFAAVNFNGPDEGKLYVRASGRTLDAAPGFNASATWPALPNDAFYASNDPSLKKALDQSSVSDQDEMAQKAAAVLNPGKAAPWTRRASQWIGREVRSANGDRVGRVEDLVIDCKSGDVAYACIEEDPSFNPGSRYIAIPMGQLRSTPDSERLVLNIGSNDIKAMAGIDKEHWPATAGEYRPTGKDGLESLPQ